MTTAAEYAEAHEKLGTFKAVAEQFGVNISTVSRAVNRYNEKRDADPAIHSGMTALGLDTVPLGGWIKNSEPDENGRTYSFYVKPEKDGASEEDRVQAIEDRFRDIPAVHFPVLAPIRKADGVLTKAFISINDLHAGCLAWGAETGYGDWDLNIALSRLTNWIARLMHKIKSDHVDEIILYYNGDTLHSNGDVPMTGTHGTNHILDVDSRQFKTVNNTAESIVVTGDLAVQVAPRVRIVIKRGNHDSDSYLALLQAAKWRYRDQPNVTVEMDPSHYWAHAWGDVLLFGHHGDKIKPERMIMMMADRHRKLWGEARHVYAWTGDKHHRKVEQFPGVVWEQASCWTETDLYGSTYGSNALAQAVIYKGDEGEVSRYTVKDIVTG